jgi:hypothetical protein
LLGLTDNPKQDLDSCIGDEQAARDQLTKDWANYPALAKSTCINPNEYLPGYVEWQACIEMTRDVITLRKDQAAAAPADSHASSQSSGTSSQVQGLSGREDCRRRLNRLGHHQLLASCR